MNLCHDRLVPCLPFALEASCCDLSRQQKRPSEKFLPLLLLPLKCSFYSVAGYTVGGFFQPSTPVQILLVMLPAPHQRFVPTSDRSDKMTIILSALLLHGM